MSLDLEQPAPVLDSAAGNTAPVDANDGTPPDQNDASAEDLLDQQAPAADDEEEDEVDGVKLRGKKDAIEKVKAERLMQADYTRKTQEVAEARRTLEAREAELQKAAQADKEERQLYGRREAIVARLGQFQNVNWQAWADSDPAAASKAHMEFTQLQAHYGQLEGLLTQRERQKQLDAEQTSAKRANDAEAVVAREIKDWGPQKLQQFVDYGKKSGLEPESVRQLLVQFPQAAKFLDKALAHDKLLAQRLQKPAATPANPVTRVGGGAAATTKPLSETSDEEFIRRRREYISKHR